jgi:signal transduction histidine kinase
MSEFSHVPFETLHTFGRLNVHLTHELQNVMATISETSGLLEDLSAFKSSGGGVDPARLEKLLGRIVEEAERGQKLVSRINSLAHSTDEPMIRLDLGRVVRFMAELSSCFPKARTVHLDICDECIAVDAAPYYLQQLLYGCLRAAFRGLEPNQGTTLTLRVEGDTCTMRMFGLARDTRADEEESFPDKATALAAELLDATLALDRGAGTLEMRLKSVAGNAEEPSAFRQGATRS